MFRPQKKKSVSITFKERQEMEQLEKDMDHLTTKKQRLKMP